MGAIPSCLHNYNEVKALWLYTHLQFLLFVPRMFTLVHKHFTEPFDYANIPIGMQRDAP